MKRKIILILNGMFYGDRHTKFCLWSVFLIGVLAVGSLLAGLALMTPAFFVAAAVLAIVDVVLFRALPLSVGISEEAIEEEDEKNEETEVKVSTKKRKAKDKKENKESKNENTIKPSKENRKEISAKEEKEKEKTGKDKEKRGPIDYTEKEMKKLFYTYKVKKNHRPVMIDSCLKYRVKQCPAYAWVHRGQFHLLLMEKEPRKISLPESQLKKMYYEKGVSANQKKEYLDLVGRSLLSIVFNEYKPTYYSVIRNNQQQEAKNLYVIGPDIKFTNTSAKELLLLLQPEFMVEDEITRSDEYNQYFKQVYKQKILLDDGVLQMKAYQNKIRVILKRLAEASITPAAVRMTLADMVQKGLISNDYANYYIQYNRQYREKGGR